MNNITSNSFKRYSYFPSSVPKTESKEAKKKRSSFYDDYLEKSNQNKEETGFSINRSVLKLPDLTPQKTQPVLQNPETTGSAIKKNIESVLSQKYGELDTRHIFDGIDDKDIEDYIETAENTIKTNVDRGVLSQNALQKLPNLLDGLALSYAAANKGKSRAATRAREAAYTESEEPLLKDTGMKLFSAELPKAESIQKTPEKKTEFSKLIANPNEKPKMTNLLLKTNESPNLTDGLEKVSTRVIPEGTHGIRFRAESQNSKSQANVNEIDEQTDIDIINDTTTPEDNSTKVSSTTDKFDYSDLSHLYDFDLKDIIKNFQTGDYVSAYVDLMRNNSTSNFYKNAKNFSRVIWKLGCDYYLRKEKNYNFSADLLEHSLQENPKDLVFYDDSDVAKTIKNDPDVINKVDEVVSKLENKIVLTDKDTSHRFKSDDLFFSINNCNFYIDNIEYNTDGTKDITVHINDTYDFTKIWSAMEDAEFDPLKWSFGGVANDFGTITSKLDAINPYKVDIYFTIRR